MGKCLNCGREVKNKFCNTSCQNSYRSKQKRLEYELNPNVCKYCGCALPWEKRRNLYCNSSCAASENNKGVKRFYDSTKIKSDSDNIIEPQNLVYKASEETFRKIIDDSNTLTTTARSLGYKRTSSRVRELILQRCRELNIEQRSKEIKLVKNQLKGDLFNSNKNWQSARSNIRRDAWKVFNKSGKDHKCCICGYDKYIEVAHIKAVSKFPENSLISDINNIHNLVPLCPNHHWEFDHNCLSDENISKIKEYSAMDQ